MFLRSVCAATAGTPLLAADQIAAFDANAAPPASARGPASSSLPNAICAFDEGKCSVGGAAAARVWQVRARVCV